MRPRNCAAPVAALLLVACAIGAVAAGGAIRTAGDGAVAEGWWWGAIDGVVRKKAPKGGGVPRGKIAQGKGKPAGKKPVPPKKQQPKKQPGKKPPPKKQPGKNSPPKKQPQKKPPPKKHPQKKPPPKKKPQEKPAPKKQPEKQPPPKKQPQKKPPGKLVQRSEVDKRFVLTLSPTARPRVVRRGVSAMQNYGTNAGCAVLHHYPKLSMMSVRCESVTTPMLVLHLLARLNGIPGVLHATPDALLSAGPSTSTERDVHGGEGPRTPMFLPVNNVRMRAGSSLAPYNWGLDRIDEDYSPLDNFPVDYSCYPQQGAGVKVYVIDTGCKVNHDEFSEAKVATRAAPDSEFYNGEDDNGHGTHIAGVIVGKNVGVARSCEVECIKAFDRHGNGAATDVISAVEYVIDEKERDRSKPVIVNLSYSALTGFSTTALDEIVFAASSRGIVFAVSAGNAAVNSCLFSPSKAEQALTVTASTQRDTLEVDSNIGPCVEFVAPGHEIVSAWINSRFDYSSENGTSMATPHVVGLSALLLAENLHLQNNPRTVRDKLYEMLVSRRSVDVATFLMPLMETGCGTEASGEASRTKRSQKRPSQSTPRPSRMPLPSATPSASPEPSPSRSPSPSPSPSLTPRPKYQPEDKEFWEHRHGWEMEQDLGGDQAPPPSSPDSYYQYGFGPHTNPYEDSSAE